MDGLPCNRNAVIKVSDHQIAGVRYIRRGWGNFRIVIGSDKRAPALDGVLQNIVLRLLRQCRVERPR